MIIENKDMKPYPQPENIPIVNGKYMLTHPFLFVWASKDTKRFYKIIVPKGFKYDGASIPRLLWTPLGLSKDGIHRAAATVHDYLYNRSGVLRANMFLAHKRTHRWQHYPVKITRKQTDDLFYQMLRGAGIGRMRAKAMHWAVRMFGGKAWKK